MVIRPDCVVPALEAAEAKLGVLGASCRILLSPQGARFDQVRAVELAALNSLVLVCGRYEGFDARVRNFVDVELSIGDFVLTGGEVAAMCVIESVIRLLPGVLGNSSSPSEESFSAECGGLLEYPHYTRPVNFRGLEVPEVLRSGDHAQIRAWRLAQSLEYTRERRPDILVESHGKKPG